MMHPLHNYVAKQLAERIKERQVVVWYDEQSEFRSFMCELRGGPDSASRLVHSAISGLRATLVEYAGSLFELRSIVEPLVSKDKPETLVIYVPGVVHDAKSSVLMELEKAGRTWKPELKQLAKNVLLQTYTIGVVDELLPAERNVTYDDLARAAAGQAGAEPPSILKSIFHDASGNDGLLTAWLVNGERDAEILSKGATVELAKLVKVRLGLDTATDAPLEKLRAVVLRFILAGEFRLDLSCAHPASLAGIPSPATKGEESAVREIARRMRTAHADSYAALADRVEQELGLGHARLPAGSLGSIDTFRFEERALLSEAGTLVAEGEFEEALSIVTDREQSFWLDRDVNRKAQWEAVRLMAELGSVAMQVRQAVSQNPGDAAAWFDAYVCKTGWFRLDQAQRQLETLVASLEEEPDERPLGIVRRAHEDTCRAMSDGFGKALAKAGWSVAGSLHQTRIWSEVVASKPKPVVYFLVDAMRFEMGVELAERLPRSFEVSTRAALAALPSITPVGMAALQPGASSAFGVTEHDGKLGADVDGSFMPDLVGRKRHAAARVPKVLDLTLEELLSFQPAKLSKRIGDAPVVIVRSQEIDLAGETGFQFQARQLMDLVVSHIARGLGLLARAGIEHAVVTADHGHLFFATDRDDSMRIDPPGGHTVELHRRCWIGRGGSTPPGCIRVAASSLGYASDLDFVFPSSTGVFRAGGDLAYYHGGASIQELAIPVLSIRMPRSSDGRGIREACEVSGVPSVVSTRIFSATVRLGEAQLSFGASSSIVRPMLLHGTRQVGSVGLAVDAPFDRTSGCVTLEPGRPTQIAFLLNDDSVDSVTIVIQDHATDAELYRTSSDIPVRLGM